MQQRPLGRSGLAVSRLALGTMTWGRETDADDAAEQVKTFLDAGGTLIDTADVYADGEAEAVLGGLLHRLVPRDEVVIATKAGQRPGHRRRRDASRGHLVRALDAALSRLGTDHVDLWQVHGFDPDTPRPSRNRPPLSRSRVAAVIAVMVGVRAGIWKIAEPTSIRSVCAASQANSVAASEPYASATQTAAMPSRSASRASASRSAAVFQLDR
jgi:aryl-alcohol dehydrogenase-like predicted oxidoreductase